MSDAELKRALRERAYLEGDFVLRSGKRSRFYLDKYRFSTQPDLLEAIAARIAAAVSEAEPEAVRLAAPELGAVPLAAGASLASRLPYLIVRGQAKEYGTAQSHRGPVRARREGLPRRGCRYDRRRSGRGDPRAARSPGSSAGRPSASSTARREGRTRSPGSAFVYARSSAQPRFSRPEKPRKTRMVEPIRWGCYAHQAVNDPEGRSCW